MPYTNNASDTSMHFADARRHSVQSRSLVSGHTALPARAHPGPQVSADIILPVTKTYITPASNSSIASHRYLYPDSHKHVLITMTLTTNVLNSIFNYLIKGSCAHVRSKYLYCLYKNESLTQPLQCRLTVQCDWKRISYSQKILELTALTHRLLQVWVRGRPKALLAALPWPCGGAAYAAGGRSWWRNDAPPPRPEIWPHARTARGQQCHGRHAQRLRLWQVGLYGALQYSI